MPLATPISFNDAQVTATKTLIQTGKGGPIYRYRYTGTFATRDGALLVVSPPPRKSHVSRVFHETEKKMLKVLFSTRLNPRADPAVAAECETRDGIRSAFSRLLKAAGNHPVRNALETRSNPDIERHFDCLLLVGAASVDEANREGSQPTKVGSVVNADVARKHGNTNGRKLASLFRSY